MSLWPLKHRPGAPMVMALDAQCLAWHPHANTRGPTAVADWALNPAAVVAQALGLARAAAAAPRTQPPSVDLIFAGNVVKHWLQTPPKAVASFEELQMVAQARCSHLFGHTPADWTVTADWHTTRPFVCAALPAASFEALTQDFAAQGVAVRGHTAWGLLTSRQAQVFASDGWSAVHSPLQVMVWHCTRGHVDALAALPLHAGQDSASVAAVVKQHIQVEAARAAHLVADTPGWLNLAAPGATATEAEAALSLAHLLTAKGRP